MCAQALKPVNRSLKTEKFKYRQTNKKKSVFIQKKKRLWCLKKKIKETHAGRNVIDKDVKCGIELVLARATTEQIQERTRKSNRARKRLCTARRRTALNGHDRFREQATSHANLCSLFLFFFLRKKKKTIEFSNNRINRFRWNAAKEGRARSCYSNGYPKKQRKKKKTAPK